uniref:Ubiquitin carboxyl-terminal hydrolase n=1 Tax=Strigamia maritima TaxID=126957 RepID=T1J2D1_STRMM
MNQQPVMSSACPHITTLGDYTKDDIIRKQKLSKCDSCEAHGLNLWACLHRDCLYVGCGEKVVDHSTLHFKEKLEHCLTLNLTTYRVWCYICECEVFLDSNTPAVPGAVRRISGANVYVADIDTEDEDECDNQNLRPRGLTGLQNIGNTCYMNAAIQALSNCPPLTQFFLDCSAFIRSEKRPGLSKSYMKLMMEMWHKKRPSYVVPSTISYGIKMVCPMFRGYTQQDSQEFLRCFMDQLHEELKEPVMEINTNNFSSCEPQMETVESDESSQSEAEYETCDSGLSSEKSSYSDESGDTNEIQMRPLRPRNKNAKCAGGNRDSEAMEKLRDSSNNSRYFDNNTKNISVDDSGSLVDNMEIDRYSDAVSESMAYGGGGSGEKQEKGQSFDMGLEKNRALKGGIPSLPAGKTLNGNLSPVQTKVMGLSTQSKTSKKKKQSKYRSIISDVFDGKILSSVQCLTCDRVSTTKETFQDLSLPIPSREYLSVLHASQGSPQKGALSTCTDVYNNQGWFNWMFGWMKSWLWGPIVSLQDCLAAFFSADELKGDNMYSCEKCKKLRNGIKYSKVLDLPEILCIHLKRFRHEVMFSSKISTYVSFPLEGLDMQPFLYNQSSSEVTLYDLVAVICHHGTAGGGHYTTYALNCINDQWYEFDDQYVTEVDPQAVANCEAYVLFYRKASEEMNRKRQRAIELMEISKKEPSLMQFYVSKQWVTKFNSFAVPGPITNTDFLCQHGGVPPFKATYVEELCIVLSQAIWEYLHDSYGGGPACNHLYVCPTCQQEQELLERRQKQELDTFIKLNKDFQAEESPNVIYAISMNWFRQWENFARGKDNEPPGPIENNGIVQNKSGQILIKVGSDHAQLSEPMWQFFYGIYSGGPELLLRQNGTVSTGAHQTAPHTAPCSVHTTGKSVTPTVVSSIESGQITEMKETDKRAGGDVSTSADQTGQSTDDSGFKTDNSSSSMLTERL